MASIVMDLFICLLFLGFCSIAVSDHPTVCPLGYDQVDRKCFKVIDLSMTFFEAVTACDVIDGKLVEIASQEDQTRVVNYLVGGHKPQYSTAVWLGATNLQGKWMFMSSKNQDAIDTWSAWAPGYPKLPTQEDPNNCGALMQNSGWAWGNAPCSYHQGALCYVALRDDVDMDVVG